MDPKYKKMKWNLWESIVADHYLAKWYILLEKNYTIQWWELDLILQKDDILTFVEVKVVDHTDQLHEYVSWKKLWHVRHTIEYYLLSHPTDKEYILDVVFVRDNSILETYENVTNT